MMRISEVAHARALAARLIRPTAAALRTAAPLFTAAIAARSFHCQSATHRSLTALLIASLRCARHRSTALSHAPLLATNSRSLSSTSVPPSSAAAADQSSTNVFDLASHTGTIDPSLLDNPITHAPVFQHSFSEAWEAAARLAFAPTNDHYFFTQSVEFVLDFAHLWTGLPWWATIVVVTIGVRAAFIPLSVFQAKHVARLQQMRPEMTVAQAELRLKQQSEAGRTVQDAKQYQEKIKAIMAKHNTNPLYSLLGPVLTMPVFMSFFFAIQAMHEIHPSFTAGGVGHVLDLSLSDPYYLLPVISSITLLLPQEVLGNTEMTPDQFAKMKTAFRIVAVVMVPLAGQLPAGLFIYWITSNLWTFAQAAMFRMKPVRALLRLPPLGANGLPLPLQKLASPASQPVTFANFSSNFKSSKSSATGSGGNSSKPSVPSKQ